MILKLQLLKEIELDGTTDSRAVKKVFSGNPGEKIRRGRPWKMGRSCQRTKTVAQTNENRDEWRRVC